MDPLGAAAFRILCAGPRIFRKPITVESCIIKRVFLLVRPYSISSAPFRRKAAFASIPLLPSHFASPWTRAGFKNFQTARAFASARIITRFEDLPESYEDAEGLPFRAKPLSPDEAVAIFGRGVRAGTANSALRVLHGRRVAGTLADPALRWPKKRGWDDGNNTIALSWLRSNVPVDEQSAAGLRAEIELLAMEDEALAKSERLGLYKPNIGPPLSNKNGKNGDRIYGKGVFERMREESERRWVEKEKVEKLEQERLAKDSPKNAGTLAAQNPNSRVELRKRGENPRLEYYLERAKVLPDVPPEMSAWQRLWPTGLFTVLVIGLLAAWAHVYTPPSPAARLWPDMPPAAATILGLMLINAAVFMSWRFAPAFRTLNMYFINVPGYPRAIAALGNTFSHQSFSHIAVNMLVIWFIGTRLHDDIGRANFLAIYLSSGVFASFVSLAIFTFQKNFVTSSLGASGSVAGITAAFLWLHKNDYFKVFGLPPPPFPGVTGLGFLIPIVLVDVWGLRKVGKLGFTYDCYAHLGGFAAGIAGAEILKRRADERRRVILEMHNKMLQGPIKSTPQGRSR